MKEKKITIKVNVTKQRQWANLLLDLKLHKTTWKPFGMDSQ